MRIAANQFGRAIWDKELTRRDHLENSIGVGMVQGVRAFGTESQFTGVAAVIEKQMQKMTRRQDLTQNA